MSVCGDYYSDDEVLLSQTLHTAMSGASSYNATSSGNTTSKQGGGVVMEASQTMAASSSNKVVNMTATQKASTSDEDSFGSEISHMNTKIYNLSSICHGKAKINNTITTNIHLKPAGKTNAQKKQGLLHLLHLV